MATQLSFPPVFLTDATTGRLVKISELAAGAALVHSEPILGGYYQAGHLTVYVSGTTPLAMRSAQEDGLTGHETWLVDELPAGIREIDLTDCRREFQLRKAA